MGGGGWLGWREKEAEGTDRAKCRIPDSRLRYNYSALLQTKPRGPDTSGVSGEDTLTSASAVTQSRIEKRGCH